MIRIDAPGEDEPVRLFVASAIIACSAAITWMGYERRRVEAQLLRLRDLHHDIRETEQNTRESGQNTRETEQNRRDTSWEERP